MYLEYFGFREKPFSVTPNPRFIFLSKNHREAFAHLLYGINNHSGFIELTGEVGTGKTTVLRTFLNRLDEDSHRTALIFNPCLSSEELLRTINREFIIPYEGLSRAELLESLNVFLLEQKAAGRNVVLVIDEAQNLAPEVLEQIRLISNLETETDKLIQIVLAGQPELEGILEKTELRQLRQRILVHYHLLPMDFEDTKGYIEHRLELAGGGVIFVNQALKRIFRYSGGVPRLINIACDRALLIGYTEGSREIQGRMAAAAVAEIKRTRSPKHLFARLRLTVLATLAILLIVGIYAALGTRQTISAKRMQPAVAAVPDPLNALRKGFSGMDEAESVSASFKAIARLWNVSPVANLQKVSSIQDLEKLALQRGLRLTPFTGSLDLLLRSDSPALLEFTIPGVSGKRYLALVGKDNDQLLISPPLAGHDSLSSEELKALWSGRSYLFWKNIYNIRPTISAGSSGWRVSRLQQLLAGAGFYKIRLNGVFDAATQNALKQYRLARGIEQSDRVGELTLLFLYKEGKDHITPKLEKRGGNRL
ncbi:AAA family ATPase [Geotalea uraniireducens]|uniref:Peptidoglycan-binding domain 1 protein n=1 Tax=Geotalea uraniireducens (strain Rf4) TaxID=351605 RepID=A5GE27_GEOUR|nr:AAA family ATPase [Geotalea uraniireducens]ABQ25682.1 Peptidoglycan-binding domain 1 protein [Geotalea uraniireducens Rf4]